MSSNQLTDNAVFVQNSAFGFNSEELGDFCWFNLEVILGDIKFGSFRMYFVAFGHYYE